MATPWQDFMNWAFSQQQQPAVGQPRELVGALNSQRPPATGGITVGARPGQGSPRPAASSAPAEPSFADSLRERLRAITDNPNNRFSKLDNRELGSVLSSAASAVGQLAGPRVGPVSIAQTLAALSGGVSAGFDNVEQRAATQQHRDLEQRLREAQIRSMEEKAAAEAAEEQRRAQYLASQSPETRAIADAYNYLPAGAAGRLYPEPPKPKLEVRTINHGGTEQTVLMDMNTGQVVDQLGTAPRWAPQQPQKPQIFGGAQSGYFALGPDGQPQQLVPGQQPGAAETTAALQTRAAKIQDAIDQFGLSQPEATALVDGHVQTLTDPVSGQSLAYNRALGTAAPIEDPRQFAVAPPPATTRPLYDLAENAAGFAPFAQEAASAVTGQFGGPVAEQVIADRQTLRTAQNELIRALSINPRFPVAEMERLRDEISIAPRFWDSPDGLRARMRSVDASLRTRLQNEMAAANNESLPRETRQAAAQAANDINNYLALLGVPQQGQRVPVAGTTSSGVGWRIVD